MNPSIIDYIAGNYISLILLVGLTVIITLNKDAKIPAVGSVYLILLLAFAVIVSEMVTEWASEEMSRVSVNYAMTALRYILYPFIIALEVFVLTKSRLHRMLILIPAVINALVVLRLPRIDSVAVFHYSEKNYFISGNLHFFPFAVNILYLILLVVFSYTQFKEHKRFSVVVSVSIITITGVTMILEYENVITDMLTEITLIDIYIYYFYLTTIYRNQVHRKMLEKERELSKSKVRLMQEQISPHFMYNALAIIKSLVRENPEQASETIDDFSTYLRQNISALRHNENMIPFTAELEHIKALQRIHEAGLESNTNIIYDVRESGFRVPPLTIEPLFENALIHGIGEKREAGVIQIISDAADDHYIVSVIDNGRGFDANSESFGDGINNVRQRLKHFCGGTLDIQSGEEGTTATVYIPKNGEKT
ncbi:MAG: histidine kinase [Ruminococcus sp.]|nr:histidine kinase [Ruminococcus sp.]